jgi:ferredoxin
MAYDNAIFYYLTGTGNSYRAARFMNDACTRSGCESSIAPLQRADVEHDFEPGSTTLLGLSFPAHGFIAPGHLLRFITRLPRGRGTHALVMPTRGGTKIGRLFLPGMEGTAGYLSALLLLLKGYRVRAVAGLDMPVSWIAAHPGMSKPSAEAISSRAEAKVGRIMERVLAGRRYLSGFIPLLLGIALLPVSLAYLVLGRLLLSKLFFASNACTGCGQCATHCPMQAIKMWGKSRPRPYWTFRCESCMRCMAFCPTRAVQASHPLAALLIFVTSLPAWIVALEWIHARWPWLGGTDTLWVQIPLQFLYVLGSITLTYLVFILLMRVRFINTLFTYTTPTRYYRRYRHPGVKIDDIS